MDPRYIYRNAPLQEVIAEIHLKLQDDGAGNGVDPVFRQFRELFGNSASEVGYAVHEPQVPPEIPLELLGHKVTDRYRKSTGEWPLFQIGPGVLTANIVPPYLGWESFRPIVNEGFDLFFRNYPIKIDLLKVERLMLRYVNVFTEEHGLTSLPEFVRDELGLVCSLNEEILETINGGMSKVLHSGRFEFPLESPKNSVGQIFWGKGQINVGESPTLGLELRVIASDVDLSNGVDGILTVMDESRTLINKWFEGLISTGVRDKLMREELVSHGN